MSCHCACLKGNEIKVIMTPGGGGSSSVSIVDAYMETENILVLTMSNGQVFRIDLSEIPFEDVVEFITKNGELFISCSWSCRFAALLSRGRRFVCSPCHRQVDSC